MAPASRADRVTDEVDLEEKVPDVYGTLRPICPFLYDEGNPNAHPRVNEQCTDFVDVLACATECDCWIVNLLLQTCQTISTQTGEQSSCPSSSKEAHPAKTITEESRELTFSWMELELPERLFEIHHEKLNFLSVVQFCNRSQAIVNNIAHP